MVIKVERHQDRILLWDYEESKPVVLDHQEAVELAQQLLDMAGKMKQEEEDK